MPMLRCLLVLIAWMSFARAQAPMPPAVSPSQARDDVQLAIDLAEAALPQPLWHQSAAEWQRAKTRAFADAARADDAMDVYVAVARLMGHIGEGHLDVFPGEAARAAQRAGARLLPLDLHWSRDGVFVSAVHGNPQGPPTGSRVLSINGSDADALRDELVSLSSRDGRIVTGAMRECGGSCYAVLRHRIHGDETTFDVRYLAPDGSRHRVGLAPHPMRERAAPPSRERRIATLEWLEPGLAYLDVSSFSNRVYREAGTTFPLVIQRLFDEIRARDADRMILDLRENGGGSEPNEAILFSYLVAEPLRRYRSVEARGQTLSVTTPSGSVLTHEVFDEEEMKFQQRRADGRLQRIDRPPEGLMSHWRRSSPVFDGALVVLISGRTFSGGAELASMLHHTRRARFVGEETGGTYEGNTSGYSWEVVLPHSEVELSLPLLRFRFDWDADVRGRGVMPDCDVSPRVDEIGLRRDRAWQIARRVLDQARDVAQPCPSP